MESNQGEVGPRTVPPGRMNVRTLPPGFVPSRTRKSGASGKAPVQF